MSASDPKNLSDFVERLQSSGRYTFTRQEALSALEVSEIALQSSVRRLAARGRIVTPRRGFHVVVPTEYRTAGAPPPSWFIDDLMRFHRHEYYVGLLTAAALHGAAHQQPQEFQVVTDTILRPATVGRARIRFFLKRRLSGTPTIALKTETGVMRVATPEATALDLVRYVQGAGQLGNIATVLAGLAEHIAPGRLVEAARSEVELSVIQRLGFLLDRLTGPAIAEPMARWLATKRPRLTPLRPERKPKLAEKNERWQVIVNASIEADE